MKQIIQQRAYTRSNTLNKQIEKKNGKKQSTIQMCAIALNNEHYKQINELTYIC